MKIAVSAVALVEGGPLTILLQAIEAAISLHDHQFYFLVHGSKNLPKAGNIEYICFPKANRSYIRRLLTEYFIFWPLSKNLDIDIWLSLGDTTPRVKSKIQAVYCHNPLPFLPKPLRYLFREPNISFRALFYKNLYKFRVGKNSFLIAQQEWFTRELALKIGVPFEKLLTVSPAIDDLVTAKRVANSKSEPVAFAFYPSLPRAFKNFEEAMQICSDADVTLGLTMDGSENRYARSLINSNKEKKIVWMGKVDYERCLDTIASSQVVLFPSHLETYGLPLAEAIHFNVPLVVPINPWTLSIASLYKHARFYSNRDEAVKFVRDLKKNGKFTLPNLEKIQNRIEEHLKQTSRGQDRLIGFKKLFERLILELRGKYE